MTNASNPIRPQQASNGAPHAARQEATGPALSRQLNEAAACLLAVQAGRSLSDVLPKVPGVLRPGVQALVFHGLRQAGITAALVRLLAPRAPAPAVRALLQMALSLSPPLCEAQDAPHYATHTLVSQTVFAAKAARETQAQAGFVNACLRRFLREAEVLLARAREATDARWNHPAWWVKRLQQDHPTHWERILAANNRAASMCLRVNQRHVTRDVYLQRLAEAGLQGQPVGEVGVLLAQGVPVQRLPGFEQGDVSVQDFAAQMAAPLLLKDVPAGARVLDACAAPGGKTAHVLESADLQVLALDKDPQRCERIHDNLHRLGLRAEVRHADAGQPAAWWDGQPFDAILLDAPCTASGIVRRHPDVRWLRRESDIAQLAAQQRALLEALWPLLKPSGCLLYATCSVFRAEGSEQVQAFLERHNDARLGQAPGHLLPGAPNTASHFNDNAPGEHDGFYYARLEKAAP